jgi:iron complex transport system permease protein
MSDALTNAVRFPATRDARVPREGAPPLAWVLLVAAVAGIGALGLTIGVVLIPLDQVWTILTGGDAERVSWTRIVLDYRLPRVLTALVAGAALGATGLLLQTTFRNPLADPWFLGLVHSARLGVAVFVVFAGARGASVLDSLGLLSNLGLVVSAAAGALAMTLALTALAPRVTPVTLLLTGLMLGQAAEGLISVVLHFTSEAQARVFASWNDGTFVNVTFGQLQLLGVVVTGGIAAAVLLSRSLDVMLLGDEYARTLGIAVTRVRAVAVGVAALLTGAVTAYCGPIAFLGILAPHLARSLFRTASHRTLLPATLLVGAGIATAADLVTHGPWSKHFFHLNAMMGLVGAPVVLVLLFRRGGLRSLEL